MENSDSKQLVEAYIEAYNRFDVDGMVRHLHENVVFQHISDGEVTLTTTGKESFRRQAEQAKQYFSERQQRITDWRIENSRVEIAIDYRGVAAIKFANGLKPGDELTLQGKSIFEFENHQIISIQDIS